MELNSSVVACQTFPPCPVIAAFPPGCQSSTLVASYTFPSTTIQQSLSLLCFSISSLVNCFSGAPAACLASSIFSDSDNFIQPPSPVPGSVGCLNRIDAMPSSFSDTSGLTIYQQLFIIPIVFQDASLGCVFLK